MTWNRWVVGALSLLGVGGTLVAARRSPSAVDRGPIARVVNASRPRVEMIGRVRHVYTTQPTARLIVDTVPPAVGTELLWLDGRTTAPAMGGVLALDGSGGVVMFDARLRPTYRRVRGEGRDWASVSAAPGDELWLSDATGALYRADVTGELHPLPKSALAYPSIVSDGRGGAPWLVRSSQHFGSFLPTGEEPLLESRDAAGAARGTVGRAITPAHVLLQDLDNAGALTVTPRALVLAPFIRDEVIALSFAGETLWVAHRGLPQSTQEPRFEIDHGRPVVNYSPVNIGARLGPDGHLYVLSTPGFTTQRSRLDVLDLASGVVLRTIEFDTAIPTIAADESGRVYRLESQALLAGAPSRAREPVPTFTLPRLAGDSVRSADFRGHVTLVNVWASWCEPCRTEMPALDSLQHELSGPGFQFLSLNDDVDEGAARRFLATGRYAFPVALGRGRVRNLLHAPGMPITTLVDAEGREIHRWIGYAGPEQVAAIRALARAEVERLPMAMDASVMAMHHH
jgi:thiol-disulfide isomerase/thioredoxin